MDTELIHSGEARDAVVRTALAAALQCQPSDFADGPRSRYEAMLWMAIDKAVWYAMVRLDRASDPRPLTFMERRYCIETANEIAGAVHKTPYFDTEKLITDIWASVFEQVLEASLKETDMIEFITKSGSIYRINMSARTVECIEPPESAFPPRLVSTEFDLAIPKVGARYIAVWAQPNEHGHTLMRTSIVVEWTWKQAREPASPEDIASMGRVGRRLFGPEYTAPGEAE